MSESLADLDRYWTDALRRLDLLLEREVHRLRARYELSLDELRGLYVSDAQVDALLCERRVAHPGVPEMARLTEHASRLHAELRRSVDRAGPWHRCQTRLGLSGAELDVLLFAVAPEIDAKYEALYAYLNNDAMRRWPTIDLALRVCADRAFQRRQLRSLLIPDATLFASGALLPVHPGATANWRSSGFRARAGLTEFLLGEPYRDPQTAPVLRSLPPLDPSFAEILAARDREALTSFAASGRDEQVLVIEGEDPLAAGVAARWTANRRGREVYALDLRRCTGRAEDIDLAGCAFGAALDGRVLWASAAEVLVDERGSPGRTAEALANRSLAMRVPLVFTALPGLRWDRMLPSIQRLVIRLGAAGPAERRRSWDLLSRDQGVRLDDGIADQLSHRYRSTAAQIRDVLGSFAGSERPGVEELGRAVCAETRSQIGSLAELVHTGFRWRDLVLPATALARLREIAAAIRNHDLIYSAWRFEHLVGRGRGMRVMFAGPSGTGKTMAASVLANEVGLDLFSVDLSAIVSKYIGETEKHLSEVFDRARDANAILMFDEADALFGKRSEVSDAKDRWANIEVSFLLQKLESHDGNVVLATNLRNNVDEAFWRRLHTVIEFPPPDAVRRERLWRSMFPAAAPLAADLDFRFVAAQFDLTGGEIRNAALEAAFLAAENGRVIDNDRVIIAVARQLAKRGKVPARSEFLQYWDLVRAQF